LHNTSDRKMRTTVRIGLLITFTLLFLIGFAFYYKDELEFILKEPAIFWKKILKAGKLEAIALSALIANLAIFITGLLVELLVIEWKKSTLYRFIYKPSKSLMNDLICWTLSILNLFDFILLFMSFGFFYLIASIISKKLDFAQMTLIENPILLFIALVIIGDIKHFLWHRFMHVEPFWRLHKFHHSATEFNLITTARGHFLEKGFLTIFDALIFVIFQAPVVYFVYYIYLREFYQMILHSDVKWSLGWVGRWVLISPQAHKIHHSTNDQHFDKNFGTLFIWWDKLFGTYHYTNEDIEIGLENNPYNKKGFIKDVWFGVTDFFQTAFNIKKDESVLK